MAVTRVGTDTADPQTPEPDPRPGSSSSASLSVRLIDGCTAYPWTRVATRPGELLMGVFDRDGRYVEGSAIDRRSGERGAPVPLGLYAEPIPEPEPEAIYAGLLSVHFGHFLVEGLARAWYAARHPQLPFVWAGNPDLQIKGLLPWQLEILDILGIENPTRVLVDPTGYDLLHVPDIGFR